MVVRRLAWVLCVGLVAVVVLGVVPLAEAQSESGLRFGVHGPPAPWEGLSAVERVEDQVDHPVGVVHWFQSWDSPWQGRVVEEVVASGRVPLITWEPGGVDVAGVADGAYDGYLAQWADGIAAVDGAVYLRAFPEMNGEWTDWNGDPEAVVAAWRHMTQLFAQRGADNVRWVWSPNETDEPRTQANRMERYWPGSDHVDVVGLSGFNWGEGHPSGWRSFSEIFAEPYERVQALSDAPVWLTETASAEQGGDKGAWVTAMFDSLADFPAVSALVWFNEDKERDWHLDSSPASRDAFRAALADNPPPNNTDNPTTPPPADGDSFRDTAGNPHLSAIELIVRYGITQGVGNDRYAPADTVTRDQMASFIARAIDHATDLPQPTGQGFTDVAGNPHETPIRELAEVEIVQGTTASTYSPRRPVSRAQMATFLVRAYEHASGAELELSWDHFPDDAGNLHESAVNKAADAGFTSGTSDSTFSPSAPVRRDQMASFVARMLERLVGEGHIDAESASE